MPEEEKKKHHHKFKAVTEEVGAPHHSEHKEEIVETVAETPKEMDERSNSFVVRETDNIDLNSKYGERSAFLKIFLVTFLATLLAFVVAGGIYVYFTGTKTIEDGKIVDVQTPAPEATVEPTPTPTPNSNVDVSSYKLSVLNGSGGIGIANAGKVVIEKAGFKVATVGNADNFEFTDTLIEVKPSISADVVAKLKQALSEKYSVKVGDMLDAASTYDIVVTIGSK